MLLRGEQHHPQVHGQARGQLSVYGHGQRGGLEHLSRRTRRTQDLLLIISDSSVRGIMTAGRIGDLVKDAESERQTRWC